MNNTSINEVKHITINPVVETYCNLLLTNPKCKFRACFIKKDGTEREMVFVPGNEWNAMNGIETTDIGREIVATKAHRNMIQVVEILGDGRFQPRTLNLATLIWLKVA